MRPDTVVIVVVVTFTIIAIFTCAIVGIVVVLTHVTIGIAAVVTV